MIEDKDSSLLECYTVLTSKYLSMFCRSVVLPIVSVNSATGHGITYKET